MLRNARWFSGTTALVLRTGTLPPILLSATLALVLLPALAAAMPRTYLAVTGGATVLTGDVSGDVVDSRTIGQLELGIGSHLNDNLLLEGSFGVYGTQEVPYEPILDPAELLLPESVRTYRIEANPLMMRLRYTRSGMRKGYLKPELQCGLGFLAVTRWVRNIAGIQPNTASDLLLAGEAGISALLILGKNWMLQLGARYTLTQRHELVDDLDHLDSVAVLLGFRFFLNSPRDEGLPPPKDD